MSFFKFPYTSFQQINLDWIMKTLNQLKDAIPLVQQASTIYTQAIEALADANEAVETVTDQAAAAVSTANAAQAVAGQANTTAAQANQRAAYAETDAQAAATNASTALTTAQSAASAASAAQGSANTALGKASLVYKGETYFPANASSIINPTVQVAIPLNSFSEKIVILYCGDYKTTYGRYAAWNSTEIPKDVLAALVADYVTIPCVTGYYGSPDKGLVSGYIRISVQSETVIVEAWNAVITDANPRYARVYAS